MSTRIVPGSRLGPDLPTVCSSRLQVGAGSSDQNPAAAAAPVARPSSGALGPGCICTRYYVYIKYTFMYIYTDGLYTKGTRAHTHRELIRESVYLYMYIYIYILSRGHPPVHWDLAVSALGTIYILNIHLCTYTQTVYIQRGHEHTRTGN